MILTIGGVNSGSAALRLEGMRRLPLPQGTARDIWIYSRRCWLCPASRRSYSTKAQRQLFRSTNGVLRNSLCCEEANMNSNNIRKFVSLVLVVAAMFTHLPGAAAAPSEQAGDGFRTLSG